MEIVKINPQGFCNGVKHALKIMSDVIKNPNTKKPIYMLGNLIHNKAVIDEIKKDGVIVIDGNKSRYDLLDEIDSGTVIFSAHGVSPRVYEKAIKKGLDIIDTTCPNVLLIHNQVSKYLSLGYNIIYIGTKGHPESEGIIEMSSKIHLITSIKDIKDVDDLLGNIYITNQTTLSIFDIEDIYNKLLEIYPSAIVDNKICLATTKRQEALINQSDVDLCIVVGDTSSSNSKKLQSVCENRAKIKSHLVETKADLKKEWFKDIKKVSITSGASTPSSITDEVIEEIKNITNKNDI